MSDKEALHMSFAPPCPGFDQHGGTSPSTGINPRNPQSQTGQFSSLQTGNNGYAYDQPGDTGNTNPQSTRYLAPSTPPTPPPPYGDLSVCDQAAGSANVQSTRAPPAGQKYTRCPCGCLLIHSLSAQMVICPRPNCKRILTPTATQIGQQRAKCVHCAGTFLFCGVRSNLVRCPSCRVVSSVGPATRQRALAFLVVGLLLLAAGIGVTVGTYELAKDSGGIYVVWIGAFITGLSLLLRSVYLFNTKSSTIIGTDGPPNIHGINQRRRTSPSSFGLPEL